MTPSPLMAILLPLSTTLEPLLELLLEQLLV
jgi:hypothetical protein